MVPPNASTEQLLMDLTARNKELAQSIWMAASFEESIAEMAKQYFVTPVGSPHRSLDSRSLDSTFS